MQNFARHQQNFARQLQFFARQLIVWQNRIDREIHGEVLYGENILEHGIWKWKLDFTFQF